MNKFYAVAMSAIMAVTVVVQAPAPAQAGNKEKALVAGLVVGAALAAALVSKSKGSSRLSLKRKLYANDGCGPGYFMKRGKCLVRGGDFKVSKFRGRTSKKFGGGDFKLGKKNRKFNNWQLAAIRKGCKPGLAWSKFEGCHEND